jgi:hypothetical protein
MLIADRLYTNVEKALTDCIMEDPLIILKTITVIAGLLELTKANDKRIRGKHKQAILVHVGQKFIREYFPSLVDTYDRTVSSVLDIVIHFAKNNKVIQKIYSSPCCK